ncbi:MFS transporter [Rhabdobacter roseus]|uniref:FSR family fosmidomycin resistance protein-like MFS transporter n=1 Tax=Rhabdobacter roseus TaxID=1655419 RepID=A0A840TL07_9BACT|nr:MFS transporter [Rhabdobacter roseus]MBB5284866.1 FSR family fosmidomycin resistance protein-like MFS transporter [Rhabdobacter roseus]
MKKATLPSSDLLVSKTVFPILLAITSAHLLNDTIQSLITAIYPVLRASFGLSFTQIGFITLTYQLTASLLQPLVGSLTDRHPRPYSLAIGMGVTLLGLLSLSAATHFVGLLLSVACIGVGSAIFHPEASRIAHLASGGKRGMAQSLFQVGGNAGSALGPLLAALFVIKYGQPSLRWFSLLALLAIGILWVVGGWYKEHSRPSGGTSTARNSQPALPRQRIILAISILLLLVFSKYFYLAGMSSYYTFYLMEKFQVPVRDSQLYLFLFMFSVAVGTFLGGPLGDRFGRRPVIWFSILGAAPFTLLLPHANLFWTSILSIFIGLILSSAFSAILVYAQELVPGKLGMISGLFFGFAFGMGGIGSAVLGHLADRTSLEYVYQLCAYLPLLGLLAIFLPKTARVLSRPA